MRCDAARVKSAIAAGVAPHFAGSRVVWCQRYWVQLGSVSTGRAVQHSPRPTSRCSCCCSSLYYSQFGGLSSDFRGTPLILCVCVCRCYISQGCFFSLLVSAVVSRHPCWYSFLFYASGVSPMEMPDALPSSSESEPHFAVAGRSVGMAPRPRGGETSC